MNRKRAFTLLELLTTIAILGLLVSILLPTLSAARRSAKAGVCMAHLKGIGNGFAVYLNENEDQFPPVRLERPTPMSEQFYINEYQRIAPRWQWFLDTDLGPVINPVPFGSRIEATGFFDDLAASSQSNQTGTTMSVDLFTCPSLDNEDFAKDIRDGAYGYNYQYLGNTHLGTDPSRWDYFPVGRHQVRKPGATILVGDSRGAGPKHGRHSYTLDPPRLAVERNAVHFGPDDPTETRLLDEPDVPEGFDPLLYAYSPVEARHKGHGNVVFADSHAESMTLLELGYEFEEADGVPKGTPKPITTPLTGSYRAGNKLWTGDGSDVIGQRHRP